MGRVKSRIRHDYKPGWRQPGSRSSLRRIAVPALAVTAAAVVLAALIGRGDESRPEKTAQPTERVAAAAAAPGREAPAGEESLQRRPLALPPPAGSSATATAGTSSPAGEMRGADESRGADSSREDGATSVADAASAADAPPLPDSAAGADADADAEAVADLDANETPAAAGATLPADPAPAEPASEALTLRVRKGDSLDTMFRRNGLSVVDLARMLKIKEAKNSLRTIQPGDEIEVVRAEDRVLSLTRRIDEQVSIRVVADDDAYRTEFLTNPVERRQTAAQGQIDSSLFLAGAEAGMSDTLIMNFAGIFAWDVDFALEVRKNDSFSLVYEEVWQDGRKLRDGDILAAEFVNQGQVFRALRFEDPEGRVDYFTPEGRSVRKAFLRAPLDFRRVSSNFNPNRLHPILKTKRPHRGVDYAANRGTPVKAAGDGRIILRGRKGGYGNAVIIQHGGNITTLYAHLSRFAKGQKTGSRVRQGQVIGYVGATGLATAPHLHYEYRVNGVHRNPRTVPLPAADPVPAAYREQFARATQPLLETLDAISPTRLAAGSETLAAADTRATAGTP